MTSLVIVDRTHSRFELSPAIFCSASALRFRFGLMKLEDLREAADRCFTTLGFHGLSWKCISAAQRERHAFMSLSPRAWRNTKTSPPIRVIATRATFSRQGTTHPKGSLFEAPVCATETPTRARQSGSSQRVRHRPRATKPTTIPLGAEARRRLGTCVRRR